LFGTKMITNESNSHTSAFVSKLPQITAVFWILKMVATTLGETGGDWLSMTMGFGYLTSTLIFFGIFLTLVTAQIYATKHHPYLYWAVIVSNCTSGTTLSDFMGRTLHLGYAVGITGLVFLLIAILGIWRFTAGTLDVEKVATRKSEAFYWCAILVSNTMGTALGDFLSDESGFGFFFSCLIFTAALLVILGLNTFTRVSKTLLFWLAFVLTRPFGATFGDMLTKAQALGGLNLGRGHSSLVLIVLLVAFIHFSARRSACLQKS
jgi:uncharacterized membrane-anchored protein